MKKTSKTMSLVLANAMTLSMNAYGSSTAGTAADTTAADTAAATATEATEAPKENAGEVKGTSVQAADNTVYKINVLQLVQHTALGVTNQGFIATLDDAEIAYEVDQQNTSDDQSAYQTIASKFTNDKKDLTPATTTSAAQAAAGAVSDTPVLVTAVTDPAESGLVDINGRPGGNVTGTSDLTPVKEQVELLQKILPDAKEVGILYCSAEPNSEIQAQMAKETIEAAGMTNQDFTASSSNGIQTIVQSMVGKVDAIYAPANNTTVADTTTVGMVTRDNKLPVIYEESGMVENGDLVAYGIDYCQLDYVTGQQAVRVLTEGALPADMPIGYLPAEKCGLTVSEETASTLGIGVSNLKQYLYQDTSQRWCCGAPADMKIRRNLQHPILTFRNNLFLVKTGYVTDGLLRPERAAMGGLGKLFIE